jgi:hypothetical protein
MLGLAGNLDEGRQELKPFPQVLSVHGVRGYGFIVGDDPSDFVLVAVTPEQAANFPDIRVFAAMRAVLDRETATQRKWHDIVVTGGHSLSVLAKDA